MRNFIWKTDQSLWLDAVDKYPKLPRAYHNLGKYYQDIGKKEKALEQYELSVKFTASPNGIITHLTYYNMGLIFMGFNQHDKAKECFLKAVEIGPGLSDAYNNLGVIAIKEGRYDYALDYFINALTHNKNNEEAHANLGFILLKKKRIEEAISECKKALKIKEDFVPALINLGIAYKYKGKFHRSIWYFKKALNYNHKSITAHLHLAETYCLEDQSSSSEKIAKNLVESVSIEDLSIFIDKMMKKDTLLEPPNLELLLPVIVKAYRKKADIYKSEANKLLNISRLSP
jgi:tetratricopeptide (TPR) repeat protein